MEREPAAERTRAELEGLAGMYRLLARCWLREVDAALLQWLQRDDVRPLFFEAGGRLAEFPPDDDRTASVIEALAAEYCRLLLGPRDHLPPYQSVWEQGQFQSGAAAAVQQFAEAAGYREDRLPRGLMRDHLGVQLDLMSYQCGQAAWLRDDPVQFPVAMELATAFFARHLAWPTELLRAVEGRAESEFYRSLARLTRTFLDSERAAWLGALD